MELKDQWCSAWFSMDFIDLDIFSWICVDFMDSWRIWCPSGLMTGSAGTAMDVLVTCFSKMGGGSGRRGCKSSAQSVISVRGTERFANPFFSCFSFSPNVSKT